MTILNLREDFFKGEIISTDTSIKSGDHQKVLLKYNLSKQKGPDLQDILIQHFQDLRLECHEKRILTKNLRKVIFLIQNIDLNQLQDFSSKLSKVFKRKNRSTETIQASGYGGFILLHFLCSLPKYNLTTFNVEINNCPIALLPQGFKDVKSVISQSNVHLEIEEEHWLEEFDSLCEISTPKGHNNFRN